MSQFYIPESAMAIVAHPDDIEYTCSGTLARWARAGARVSFVLCTSGDVGIAEPGMTRERAAKIREEEASEAARIVGASEIIFLREPDGMLQATMGLRKKLVREIRRFRPEVVFSPDPSVYWMADTYVNHPDHRAAGTAALEAVFPASGQPNLFEELEQEGLKAFKVRKVFITGRNQGEYFVNIDETIDIKIESLRAHKSQMKHDPAEYVRNAAAERAKGKEMVYAEAFKVITMVDDETWKNLKQ